MVSLIIQSLGVVIIGILAVHILLAIAPIALLAIPLFLVYQVKKS